MVVIWAEIWYNIGRQMRLQEDRFEWRQFGEVVDTISRVWYGEKLSRFILVAGICRVGVTTILCEAALATLAWKFALDIQERAFVVSKLRQIRTKFMGRNNE